MRYKATVEEKKAAEPAKWEFPCFAEGLVCGYTIWAVGPGGGNTGIIGFDTETGDFSSFSRAGFVPLPKADTAGWRVVLDNGGCRLEKPAAKAADAGPKEDRLAGQSYPGLFRHPSSGGKTLLLAEVPLGGPAKPGTALREDGTVRDDLDSRSGIDWVPCAGSVTVTNRPGVEFPRLYRRPGAAHQASLRTAPNTWWIVTKCGTVERDPWSDAWRLTAEPIDTDMPDGSTLTLAFEYQDRPPVPRGAGGFFLASA